MAIINVTLKPPSIFKYQGICAGKPVSEQVKYCKMRNLGRFAFEKSRIYVPHLSEVWHYGQEGQSGRLQPIRYFMLFRFYIRVLHQEHFWHSAESNRSYMKNEDILSLSQMKIHLL
jgi:hypothetical protein